MCSAVSFAQSAKTEGTINKYIQWAFDGQTLTLRNSDVAHHGDMNMPDYDNLVAKSPWHKKKLTRNIRRVVIEEGINRIGSCAFAGCTNLTEVVFKSTDVREIGWGAFMNCTNLHDLSLPSNLGLIETVAFANCSSIPSLRIPDQCRVGEQAFISCTNIKMLDISPTSLIGTYAFAKEDELDGTIRHSLYNGELQRLPTYITAKNCNEYGIAQATVEKYYGKFGEGHFVDYDAITSHVDSLIPSSSYTHDNTYALIIGNQNYRFNSDVPYAIHDARTFEKYCWKTLGIPSGNVHRIDDATKQMIYEEEFSWLENDVEDPATKKLIVYYAGHGVPDTKDKNKAYLLPTDVRGTTPQFGIALDDFYERLGNLGFEQTYVFLDACFSGVNRDNEGVNEGLRGVAVDYGTVEVTNPQMVVFSAAQGNETAQGYHKEGHGLFTYFLLKELQDTNGSNIRLGNLSDNIINNVRVTAPTLNLRKKQTPTIQSPSDNNWRSWQLF